MQPQPSQPNAAPLLSVAMCTYNGARFIEAQLRSIAAQTLLPDELVVCDDGSTDATAALVRDFAMAAPFAVQLVGDDRRLGVVRNFERALRRARGRYVALADQDDIWSPSRLEVGIGALRSAERSAAADRPVLVHSDMRVIDAEGAEVEPSFFRRRGFRARHPRPLRELVLQNYVTGCSVLVNRAVVELALPFPASISIHDWWLALVAAAAGAIVTLPQPTVGYRLHAANVIGVKRVEWRPYLGAASARELFRRALGESRALERRLRERAIDGPALDFLRRYHARVAAGGPAAAMALLKQGVRLQNLLPTASFYGHVLARRLALE